MAKLIEKIKDKRAPEPETPARRDIPVVHPAPEQGLTSAQVRERTDAGWTNAPVDPPGKTVKQIVLSNIFTYFNMLFFLLALCVIAVQQWLNLTFMGVIIVNTAIGIVQELRSKKTLDKLSILASPKAVAVRDGKRVTVDTAQLVRDDIVVFAAGNQIYADAVVAQDSCYVNEALITGESDEIKKNPGDKLLSGSFVVSGMCRAQLTDVGADSYVSRLTLEAKRAKKPQQSEMMRALQNLVKWIGVIVIPLGVVMFIKEFVWLDRAAPIAVTSTVGSIIGMIPEGLYLLTSVALAVSMIRLAQGKVLAQDMNCIETLAHVDVLCVDKTGTITEPTMEVTDVYPLNSERFSYDDIEKILAAFYHGEEPDNETARAMGQQFAGETTWRAVKRMAFSSSTKWSGADFGENGRYVVGAPEFIMGDRYDSIRSEAEPWSERGCRVLLLAAYDTAFDDGPLQSAHVAPIALVFLSNLLRPDAQETFRYFASQGVSVRVISGDNPITVAQVAARAGIENADRYVDATTLSTEQDFEEAVKYYTVFGRVTPEQKRYLVRAFQKQGHTVAMTGDGVNDVLALKDANCGIAMASGSQAASQVAQIVLLNSQFSAMPAIVAEGRRVINNIQRAASLFLVKNIFSFALTLLLLFIDMPYPLLPIQLSLISTFTIGIPSFFLALEPNYARVEGKFMRNVIRRAMPGGLTNLTIVLLAGFFTSTFGLSNEQLNTICVWVMSAVGLVTLYHVSVPFTRLRLAVLAAMTAAMLFCLLVIPAFFDLPALNASSALILVTLLLACPTVMRFFRVIFDKRVAKLDLAPAKKQKKKRHRFEK